MLGAAAYVMFAAAVLAVTRLVLRRIRETHESIPRLLHASAAMLDAAEANGTLETSASSEALEAAVAAATGAR